MSNYSDKYNSHLSKIERVVLVTTASYNHLRNTNLLAIPCGNIAAISLQNSLAILLQCCGYTGLHMQISIAVILAILPQYVSAKTETVYTLMHIYALMELS